MFLNISSHGKSRQIINATENGSTSASAQSENAITTFHLAASVGDLEALRRCGYVDIPDGMGCTPLHYAVSGHQVEAVKLLLSRGADCHRVAGNGASPLSMAKMLGDNELLQAMEHSAKVDQLDMVLREVIAAISGEQSPSMVAGLLKRLAVVLLGRDLDKNPSSDYAKDCLEKLKAWGKL